ncbi:MAG: carboxypeptidase-like regulatory domain-containing protein, partial [Chitinophagaceae bacterium]
MKKLSILILLLLAGAASRSQQTISGRVVSAATGEPLTGASVFISNTSVGTTTDHSGFFILQHVPGGRNELIASSIGYETNVFSFSAEQLPLRLRIEMTLKIKELENVIVEPFTEEYWDKWGRLFMEKFIGTTPNARY